MVEDHRHDGERPQSLHVGSEGRSGAGNGFPKPGCGVKIELKHRVLAAADGTEVPIAFVDGVDGVSKVPRSTVLTNLPGAVAAGRWERARTFG